MLRENDFIVSMSGKGNCWDNAVVESFFQDTKSRVDKQDKLKKTQFD